jgi:serine/threonine protein kinase
MFIDCYGMVCSIRIFFILINYIYLFSMDGGELFNRIRDRQDKPYTEREAANVILMIAKAVAHLHHMDMVNKD